MPSAKAARLAHGQEADRLILGLAGVGIAITAGTYASMGTAAPARVGLSVVKAARKTGRLGTQHRRMDRALHARRGRLVGDAQGDRRRVADRACGRGARRARSGEGREGRGPARISRAMSGACKPKPAPGRRSTA